MAERVADRTAGRWLDVKVAADELGISSDAVRKRIARGTLRSARDDDGTVQVWLDGVDERRDEGLDGDQPYGGMAAGQRLDELLEAKDEAIQDLRGQLEYMRREAERKDAIIMTLAQRVPELEAPRETRDAPETASPRGDGGTAPEDAHEPPQPRSWLYRFFFGP